LTRIAEASRPSIATLYLSGVLQGLTLVSFPASSGLLKQMHGFTDAQYGAIFLPQVAAAVIGAIAGGGLAARIGLVALLRVALAANALSQVLLAASAMLETQAALKAVFVGTASLGLGFGLSGAPLNGLPPLFFPRHRATAIGAMHTLLCLGFVVGPVMASAFIGAGYWIGFPSSLALFALAICAMTSFIRAPQADASTSRSRSDSAKVASPDTDPSRQLVFWLYASVTCFYALAEGTFSNWTVLYLQDAKQLPERVATSALSAFWAAMLIGRLLSSALVLRLPAERIWLVLPVLMIVACALLPYAGTPALGVGLFAFAGFACSSFAPLTIGIASARFPARAPWVSSMLIAALMIGVGVSSFSIGQIRRYLDLEAIYRLSAVYPALALALAVAALRLDRSARD